MRVFLILILLLCGFSCFATTYYVSNAGSDAANGTTTGTSWQTLSKVNGFSFASGDSILLKCGDSWNEQLKPPASNLIFASYSTGDRPIITGFVTATMAHVGGNIYNSSITPASNLNTVLINSKLSIKARFPNSTYLTFTSGTDSTLVTSLTGTPDYTGKEIVVRDTHWIIDVSTVTAQSVGNISISPKLTYPVNVNTFGGNGYFFQNDISFLDSTNEWAYAAGTLSVYSTTIPAVQYSNIDTLVWVRQKSNITFNGLSFAGANKTVFELDTSNNITIQSCIINNCGTNGITAEKSHHVTVTEDSMQNILNTAIYFGSKDPYNVMVDTCNKPTVTNCYIKNIAIYAGMGLNDNEKYYGIHISGDSCNISYNRIDSVGYIPLRWNGRSSVINYNYISKYAFIKDDAGGIYSYIGTEYQFRYDTGSQVKYNTIMSGLSATGGINPSASFGGGSKGIYMDNFVNGVTIEGNTCFDNSIASLNLNEASTITVRENTFVDSAGYPVRARGAADKLHTNTFKRNIYYQRKSTNQVVYMAGVAPIAIAASDSNYFVRPTDQSSATILTYGAFDYGFPHLWQDSTGFDLQSGVTPTEIRNNIGRLFYNPYSTDSIITLDDTYIDVYGTVYLTNQEVTLTPFTSKLLFVYTVGLTKSAGLLRF